MDGAQSTQTLFSQGPAGPLAQQVDQGPAKLLISDLHTDVVGLADPSGSAEGARSFSPWGEIREDAMGSIIGFQGDLTDPDADLVDMGARSYAPSLGRFTTPDPVVFGEVASPTTLNQYLYGLASPITYADPTGLCSNRGPAYGEPCDQPIFNDPNHGNGRGGRSGGGSTGGGPSDPIEGGAYVEHVPERPEPLPQEVFGSATLARSWAPSEAALIGACGAPNQGSLSGTSGPPCGAIGMTMGMTPDGTGFLMPSLFNLSLDLDDIDNGGARSLSAELDEAAWRSSEATRYAQLVSEARKLYPKKAGRIEHHHVAPKYLGGDKKGRTVPIDAAYHQLITNEFRRLHPYGSARPTPQRLSELMRQVYSKYPLP